MSKSSDPRQPAPGDVPATTDSTETALDAHGHDPAAYDWVPVLRKPRADGWTPQKQRAFIGHLADTGSVFTAAQRVGMSPAGAYALRRSPGGEGFAHAWDAAIQQSAHGLIDAAFERAMVGSEEPVWHNGQVVGRRFRQSDAMMMFLLRKHFPERYGDVGRDRPERALAAPRPPVAEAMIELGPVQPADPAALMHPEDTAVRLDLADQLDGALPRWARQDGSVEIERHLASLEPDAEFEAMLEAAKIEADPEGHARAEERRAYDNEQEEMERERAQRRRGRRG